MVDDCRKQEEVLGNSPLNHKAVIAGGGSFSMENGVDATNQLSFTLSSVA